MPAIRRGCFESVFPFPHRLNAEVKDPTISSDRSVLRQRCKSWPVGDADRAISSSVINAGVAQKRAAYSFFETLQNAEERVQRTARRVLVALINGDCEKPLVAPVSRDGQRRAVRAPIVKIRIDLGDQRRRRIG